MEIKMAQSEFILIGVSTCLLGEEVRYDGGHKRNTYLMNTLDQYFKWLPICPEVEIGMGTPRESLRLIGNPENPSMITVKTKKDYTDEMKSWAEIRLNQSELIGLHGYVLKNRSPSCGLNNVPVYHPEKHIKPLRGRGIFAEALVNKFPNLPIEEEGRLRDPRLRENFLERVFAYFRWKKMLETKPSTSGLVQFHTSQKMVLMAHSPVKQKELGRLVASAGTLDWAELVFEYEKLFMKTLKLTATNRKHTNVMQHLMGYVKKQLGSEEKKELLSLIEDYRNGLIPLIVPLTLLKHHLRFNDVPEWINQQVYINPYPKELMLRNHV